MQINNNPGFTKLLVLSVIGLSILGLAVYVAPSLSSSRNVLAGTTVSSKGISISVDPTNELTEMSDPSLDAAVIKSTATNPAALSTWATISNTGNKIMLYVTNLSETAVQSTVELNSYKVTSVAAYYLKSNIATSSTVSSLSSAGDSFSYSFPANSAVLLILQGGYAPSGAGNPTIDGSACTKNGEKKCTYDIDFGTSALWKCIDGSWHKIGCSDDKWCQTQPKPAHCQ